MSFRRVFPFLSGVDFFPFLCTAFFRFLAHVGVPVFGRIG